MSVLGNVVQSVLDVGAVALLPIMILLLGLFFKVKFSSALKSGLLVGIGFQGVKLVVSFLVSTLNPVIQHYVDAGSGFTIVDVGWETLSAAAWATPFAAAFVPLGLILNFLLIRTKFVKTLNVDIWNYWHLLRSAAILSFILGVIGITGMGNYGISIIFGLILTVLVEKVGDWMAPYWQKYFGLEGTTCTTILQLGTTLPIAWVVDKIIDKIPGLNKIDISYEKANERLGEFSSPTIIGAILGAFLGILTGQGVTGTIQIAVGLSAAITLTPRMVKLFMEGISPVSAAARDYMIDKLGEDAEFNIGVDIALGVGDQATITCGAFMIPVCILLAFIFPGNHFFPVAFFGSSLTYAMATVCMVSKGNMFRSLLIGIVYMCFTLFAFNFAAELCTQFVAAADVIDIQSGTLVAAGGINNFIDVILAAIYNVIR